MKRRLTVALMGLGLSIVTWIAMAGINPHIQEVDLDIEGVNDDQEFWEPDPPAGTGSPKGPGGFVALNGWKKITLSKTGVNPPMKTRLNWNSDKIEVWTAASGGNQVSNPKEWDGASPNTQMPAELWVKGVKVSTTGPTASSCGPEHVCLEAINNGSAYIYDRVAFTVPKVDITEPNENDVFLHGGKATFKAKITPGVTVDSWRWEILEGDGSPGSSSTDTYEPVVRNEDEDYDNPDIFKVKVTATVNGCECADELQIKVVYPKIDVIDFKSTKPIIHEGDWVEHNPEWTSTKTTQSVSVFTRNTKIKVDATLKTISPLTKPTDISGLYAKVSWWVTGDCDLESKPTAQPVSGDSTVITMEGTTALVDYIYAYEKTDWSWREIGYDWSYRMPETGSSDHTIKPLADDNQHDLYVTLAVPISPTVYETVLHISCSAARGETAVPNTISEVWTDGDFDDCDVQRKDGTLMKYYADGANPYGTPGGYLELLKQANGRCGTWQVLFIDTLTVQGIVAANRLNIDENVDFVAAAQAAYALKYGHPPEDDGYIANNKFANNSYRDVFFVKDWDLSASDKWMPVDKSGVKGQGNPDPLAIFGDHALVNIGGKIYDPSYGTGPFDSLVKWEDASVDGYGVQFIDGSARPPFLLWIGKEDTKGVLEVSPAP